MSTVTEWRCDICRELCCDVPKKGEHEGIGIKWGSGHDMILNTCRDANTHICIDCLLSIETQILTCLNVRNRLAARIGKA